MGLDKKLIGEQDEEIHRLNEEVNDQMVRMAIQGQNVVASGASGGRTSAEGDVLG